LLEKGAYDQKKEIIFNYQKYDLTLYLIAHQATVDKEVLEIIFEHPPLLKKLHEKGYLIRKIACSNPFNAEFVKEKGRNFLSKKDIKNIDRDILVNSNPKLLMID